MIVSVTKEGYKTQILVDKKHGWQLATRNDPCRGIYDFGVVKLETGNTTNWTTKHH